MPTQDDFPDVWTCESPNKTAKVEVRRRTQLDEDAVDVDVIRIGDNTLRVVVDSNKPLIGINVDVYIGDEIVHTFSLDEMRLDTDSGKYVNNVNLDANDPSILSDTALAEARNAEGFSWIEIPTSDVELWEEKGQAAQIQRTAKVTHPSEWGDDTSTVKHNSPRLILENFDATDAQPFQFARIWFRETGGDTWVLKHHGWIGGVGGTNNPNEHKFWVYDFSELLGYVAADIAFSESNVRAVLEKFAERITSVTPIPLHPNVKIIPPETEEELRTVINDIQKAEGGGSRINANMFSLNAPSADGDKIRPGGGTQDNSVLVMNTKGGVFDKKTKIEPIDYFEYGFDFETGTNPKTFTPNRDTLLDVFKWFENKSNANLRLAPLRNSVMLVADVIPSRRTWYGENVAKDEIAEDGNVKTHGLATIQQNNALYEIKPVNTLRLNGKAGKKWSANVDQGLTAGLSVQPSKKYPSVTVRSPALYQAADGMELSRTVVESDATTLEEAENEAIRRFSQQLSEESTGEIIARDQPRLTPFDALVAYEQCADYVSYTPEPVKYEIESVKHRKRADDVYRASITASIWANETNIETISKKMVKIDSGS